MVNAYIDGRAVSVFNQDCTHILHPLDEDVKK
jgi:hypothetical protein